MTNADKLTDFAISKLSTVFDTVSHVLPTVTKYVLEVTSLNCLFFFIPYFIFLAVSLIFFFTARLWLYCDLTQDDVVWSHDPVTNKEIKTEVKGGKPEPFNRNDYAPCVIIWYVISGVSLFFFLWNMLDMWAWTCIFHPDLYLIHLAIQKVMG